MMQLLVSILYKVVNYTIFCNSDTGGSWLLISCIFGGIKFPFYLKLSFGVFPGAFKQLFEIVKLFNTFIHFFIDKNVY